MFDFLLQYVVLSNNKTLNLLVLWYAKSTSLPKLDKTFSWQIQTAYQRTAPVGYL